MQVRLRVQDILVVTPAQSMSPELAVLPVAAPGTRAKRVNGPSCSMHAEPALVFDRSTVNQLAAVLHRAARSVHRPTFATYTPADLRVRDGLAFSRA